MRGSARTARLGACFAAAFAASVLLAGVRGADAQATGLTQAPALARIYDIILDGRFDAAAAELKRACGPAPPVACNLLEVASLWWQILMDPDSRARDAEFQARSGSAIQAAQAWTVREPRRAEAWFYLGAAYGARTPWLVYRNEKLSAARDGKRSKDSLDRALALDPTLADAHFGIGLYKYLADVVPTFFKVLRWLLAMPGGDRVEGMAEMLEARDRGQIVRGEADFHLHHMYLWYEHQPARALALVDGLERRYPHNPVFPLEIADVQDVYQHDHAASLVTYRRVLQAARDGRLVVPAIAEARARLGMAQQLDALAESDMAVEELKMVIAMRPVAPYGALARAQLGLGQAYDRLGQRARAVSAYEAARAAAPPNDPAAVRARVAEGLQRKPDARAAEAYRLSLEGWRALERGALTEADAALARAVAISPDDPVILFRRGRLFQARDERARALEQYERVIGARPATLPTILASACLEAGRLLERSGQRTRAIEMYQRAARVSGAEAETRDAAVGALARLNAATRGQ